MDGRLILPAGFILKPYQADAVSQQALSGSVYQDFETSRSPIRQKLRTSSQLLAAAGPASLADRGRSDPSDSRRGDGSGTGPRGFPLPPFYSLSRSDPVTNEHAAPRFLLARRRRLLTLASDRGSVRRRARKLEVFRLA